MAGKTELEYVRGEFDEVSATVYDGKFTGQVTHNNVPIGGPDQGRQLVVELSQQAAMPGSRQPRVWVIKRKPHYVWIIG